MGLIRRTMLFVPSSTKCYPLLTLAKKGHQSRSEGSTSTAVNISIARSTGDDALTGDICLDLIG